MVLSAILAAVFKNLSMGAASPLDITIPSQLWVLMGITTASAVSGPAILANKMAKQPNMKEADDAASNLHRRGSCEY